MMHTVNLAGKCKVRVHFESNLKHFKLFLTLKAKVVPLHAMEALVGRGVLLLLVFDLGTRWG
jgi:hypothetical protein